MTFPNPGRYPYHAETVAVTLPTVSESAGYVAGTIADPSVANALGKFGGRWDQYLDLHKAALGDTISTSLPYLVRGQSLEYLVGAPLLNNAPTTTPVVVGGDLRIPYDETILDINGFGTITFAASSRTWIYGGSPVAGSYPPIRVDTVALGDPPTPGGSEVVLGGVDTDGLVITANLPSTLGSVPTIDVAQQYSDALTILTGGSLTLDAGSSFVVNSSTPTFGAFSEVSMLGDVIVGTDDMSVLTIESTSTIEGPLTANAAVVTNGTLTANAAVTANADITANADVIANANVTVDAGGSLTLDGPTTANANVNVVAATLSSDPSALFTWNGTALCNGSLQAATRFRLTGSQSLAAGDLSKDGSDNLRYRDAGGTKFVHVNDSGRVKGYGSFDTVAAAAIATADTDTAVAPLVASDLDVHATFWVQRAIAGDVTVALNEVGGVGQIGTSTTIAAPVTGTTTYQVVPFSRRRAAADTTPRIYQLSVNGNGQNVTLKNVRITVEPAS